MNDLLKFINKRTTLDAQRASGGLFPIVENVLYILGAHNNLAAKYKKGCIIWFKVNDTTFNVYELKKETTEKELLSALSSLKK